VRELRCEDGRLTIDAVHKDHFHYVTTPVIWYDVGTPGVFSTMGTLLFASSGDTVQVGHGNAEELLRAQDLRVWNN
jgi:hypothetical protein